jgi:hypothetical protein
VNTLTQPSLRRLAQFDVRPRRDLGQNFLVDSNMLGVIARHGELDGGDVVLEIGGGLGVLSEYLAARVAHVHVVEIDRHLESPLRDALDPFANVTLHLRPRRARAAPEQADRQPSLRDRGGRDPAHGRGAGVADAMGGDGAEGRRGAPGRGARQP